MGLSSGIHPQRPRKAAAKRFDEAFIVRYNGMAKVGWLYVSFLGLCLVHQKSQKAQIRFRIGPRRGDRVVHGAALEKRSLRKWSVGSNPTLSAIHPLV